MNDKTTDPLGIEAHNAAQMIRAAGYVHPAEVIEQQAAEIARLRRIIDSRPAINAALPESYIEWSRGIYAADFARIMGIQQ